MSAEIAPIPQAHQSVIPGKELDYAKYEITHGKYQWTLTTLQAGKDNFSVSASGGDNTIFTLAPKVYNFAKSYLKFRLVPSAGGADYFNRLFLDGFTPIRQIQLYTQSGLFLADIPDFHKYTNMVFRRSFKINDVMTWNKEGELFEGLSCINKTATDGQRIYDDATAGTGMVKTSFLEPMYISSGGSGKNASGPIIDIQLCLGKIVNSIFSLDKDLYFGGENILLKIIWNQSDKIGWIVKDVGKTTTDAAAFPGNYTISRLALYMAIEVNPVIENMLKTKTESPEGFNLIIPFIHMNKMSSIGTGQTLTTTYSRSNGSKLMKIYWAPYLGKENGATAYDHNNKANRIIQNFYTSINNTRLSQFNYNCDGDDYREQKLKLRGSCILSADEYYYNWVWIEDFTNNYSMVDKPISPPEDNYIDGLPLDIDQKYDIIPTTVDPTLIAPPGSQTAYENYIYAVCQRLLVVTTRGISLV